MARNDLQQAWYGLLKMYQDDNKPLEAHDELVDEILWVCVLTKRRFSSPLRIVEDMCYERRRADGNRGEPGTSTQSGALFSLIGKPVLLLFITEVPNTKMCAWGEEDCGEHVL